MAIKGGNRWRFDRGRTDCPETPPLVVARYAEGHVDRSVEPGHRGPSAKGRAGFSDVAGAHDEAPSSSARAAGLIREQLSQMAVGLWLGSSGTNAYPTCFEPGASPPAIAVRGVGLCPRSGDSRDTVPSKSPEPFKRASPSGPRSLFVVVSGTERSDELVAHRFGADLFGEPRFASSRPQRHGPKRHNPSVTARLGAIRLVPLRQVSVRPRWTSSPSRNHSRTPSTNSIAGP